MDIANSKCKSHDMSVDGLPYMIKLTTGYPNKQTLKMNEHVQVLREDEQFAEVSMSQTG